MGKFYATFLIQDYFRSVLPTRVDGFAPGVKPRGLAHHKVQCRFLKSRGAVTSRPGGSQVCTAFIIAQKYFAVSGYRLFLNQNATVSTVESNRLRSI